jgi:TonB-dependent SusC/RagA subfamily outer membrane receptor
MKYTFTIIALFVLLNCYAQMDSLSTNKGIVMNDAVVFRTYCSPSIKASKPLFVVNGIVLKRKQIMKLDTSNIARIEILKDIPKAISLYGKRGKNGVILITTKKRLL